MWEGTVWVTAEAVPVRRRRHVSLARRRFIHLRAAEPAALKQAGGQAGLQVTQALCQGGGGSPLAGGAEALVLGVSFLHSPGGWSPPTPGGRWRALGEVPRNSQSLRGLRATNDQRASPQPPVDDGPASGSPPGPRVGHSSALSECGWGGGAGKGSGVPGGRAGVGREALGGR